MADIQSQGLSAVLRGLFARNSAAIVLAVAACAVCFGSGCATQTAQTPPPAAPNPAPVAQRPPSPQQLMALQIEGVKQNPRLTAEDKANLIRRIKGGQMGIPAAASSPDKTDAKKKGDPKPGINQNAHR